MSDLIEGLLVGAGVYIAIKIFGSTQDTAAQYPKKQYPIQYNINPNYCMPTVDAEPAYVGCTPLPANLPWCTGGVSPKIWPPICKPRPKPKNCNCTKFEKLSPACAQWCYPPQA
jgi:hypothetical protein